MNKFRPHTYCEMVCLGIESCAATQATAASRAETQAMAASSQARPRRWSNVVGGSFEYYIQQKNSREGPLDTAALGDYPHDFLERLFSGEAGFARRRRLEASLSRGTVVDTDFSGKGSVEVTLLLLDRATISLATTDTRIRALTRKQSPTGMPQQAAEDARARNNDATVGKLRTDRSRSTRQSSDPAWTATLSRPPVTGAWSRTKRSKR